MKKIIEVILVILVAALFAIVLIQKRNLDKIIFPKEVVWTDTCTYDQHYELAKRFDSLVLVNLNLRAWLKTTPIIHDTVFLQCPGGWHLHTKGVVQREFILTREECE